MKIFILEYVEQLTEQYHPGGSLVIVANSIEHAKELIKADKYIQPSEDEWSSAIIYELKAEQQPTYYIFEDAGCC